MQKYRKAKCVELHDSNIALTTEDGDYTLGSGIGRTDSPNKPVFSVQLEDIQVLAKILGVKSPRLPKNMQQGIPIYKAHHDYSRALSPYGKITVLECQIASDKQVNIKATSIYHDDPEQSLNIEELSYCGSFTIWWA